jgi:hypothetical protein
MKIVTDGDEIFQLILLRIENDFSEFLFYQEWQFIPFGKSL